MGSIDLRRARPSAQETAMERQRGISKPVERASRWLGTIQNREEGPVAGAPSGCRYLLCRRGRRTRSRRDQGRGDAEEYTMSEAEIMLVLGFVMPRTINEHDGLYDHEIADLLRAMGRRLKTGGRIDRIIGRRLETTA